MNKKKIFALCLVICLLATAVVGGTLAYFTDTDAAKNVMTTGGVSIIQNEQQRPEDGATELEDFEDGKKLYPVTDDANKDGKMDNYTQDIAGATFVDENGDEQTVIKNETNGGGTTNVFPLSKNAVDKVITVTNDGDSNAFVRTLIAFEVPTAEDVVEVYGNDVPDHVKPLTSDYGYADIVNMDHFLYTVMHTGATAGKGYILPQEDGEYIVIEINGTAYLVTYYYYQNSIVDENGATKVSALEPGQITHPSLKQIYLSSKATNEDAQLVVGPDGEYNILAVSQAVQTAGFDTAEEAMEAAFGPITAENAAEWFAEFAALPQA